MSQHDLNITQADADAGVDYRAAVNNALQAIASNNSGATAPVTTYAYQFWADTTNNRLKMRNEANTNWIDKGKLTLGTTLVTTFNTPIGSNVVNMISSAISYERYIQMFNTSASTAFTIGPPQASDCNGISLTFKKINSGGAGVKIDPQGTSTIDGAASVTLNIQYESITIISDGTDWRVIERYIP